MYLGLEHELSNAYVINELEKKLPPKVRREWSLLVQGDSSLERLEKIFRVFADFIMLQRHAVEYGNSKVRTDIVNNCDWKRYTIQMWPCKNDVW